jgi:hypothetical protein
VQLREFDRRFDGLWNLVKDGEPVVTRRDKEYLSWRYMQNPTQEYQVLACSDGAELAGYAVVKRYGDESQVVDLLTVRSPDVAMALIARVVEMARQAGLSAVSLWLNVSHPLHWVFEKAGFRNGEPITYFAGRSFVPELPQALVCDYRNWYVTMGDSDVF